MSGVVVVVMIEGWMEEVVVMLYGIGGGSGSGMVW